MRKLDDIKPQPYKSRGYTIVDGELTSVWTRTFEFKKSSERDHFVSTYEYECVKCEKWSLKRGPKGNKREVFFASMNTPRTN